MRAELQELENEYCPNEIYNVRNMVKTVFDFSAKGPGPTTTRRSALKKAVPNWEQPFMIPKNSVICSMVAKNANASGNGGVRALTYGTAPGCS